MRIAVFSDVHGNLTALDAVLQDIAQKNVDQVVFAGDLCLLGPRPSACLDRVRQAGIDSIYGNTDEAILSPQDPQQRLAALAGWTLAQLDSEERTWLAKLPFQVRISPTQDVNDSLLIVHANPVDVNQIIFPAEQDQLECYGRIRQTDEELGELVSGVQDSILAFGHLHIPSQRKWGDLRLFNISSVNIPGDGDARAKYGIFSWQDEAWTFERQFVSYDINDEVQAYSQAQPPGWERIVQTIETEGYFPQNV